MQFLIIVPSDDKVEAGDFGGSEQQFADMQAYNEEMLKAGVFVDGQGLHASSKGVRITWDDTDTPSVTDGPFAEAKEIIAGFTIIDVSSKEEAIAWAKKWPVSCAPRNGAALEVRQIISAADFEEIAGPQLAAADEQIREEAARQAAQG